jgi:hypothetical protein
LPKSERLAKIVPDDEPAWSEFRVHAAGRTLCRFLQPERVLMARKNFFIWIRRNPLKSPDSAMEKQGNPS